jgi:hypothetical protein
MNWHGHLARHVCYYHQRGAAARDSALEHIRLGFRRRPHFHRGPGGVDSRLVLRLGYLGGCLICMAAFLAAQHSQQAFEVLLDRLHLEQSEKRSPMAQQGVYLGIRLASGLLP